MEPATPENHLMSHAEYASRPIPAFAKLGVFLRNIPAVQFVLARFATLRRGRKADDETQVSQVVDEAPLDDTRRVSEKAADFAELKTVSQSTAAAPEAVAETQVSQFLGDAALDAAPRVSEKAADFAELKAVSEATAAAPESNDASDREQLIRRRWTETGIKMWNGRSALNIQGSAALLPAKPGETLPRYDTLEYRLIAGHIVCEGVVVDPPKPRK
jgi:hypothetical protein